MFRRTLHIHAALLSAAFLLLSACGGGGEEAAVQRQRRCKSRSGHEPGHQPGHRQHSLRVGIALVDAAGENIDGSSVTSLAGYHVYQGNSANNLALARTINSPGITSVVLDGLARGTHYFAVSAFLASGAESDRTPVGSKTIP